MIELGHQEGWVDCCDSVRDRALTKARLEIARGWSVMGSDQAVPRTTSSWFTKTELLKGWVETEVVPGGVARERAEKT